MKKLFLFLAMVFPLVDFAQAPILRNAATTNNPARTPPAIATSTSQLYPLMVLLPDGSGADRIIQFVPGFSIMGTNGFLSGILGAGGGRFTNTLTLNGSPVLTNAPAQVFTNDAGVIHPVDLTLVDLQLGPNNTDGVITLQPTANTNGTGSKLVIRSGSPGISGNGGDIEITAADGIDNNDGGSIIFTGGSGDGTGDGGNMDFQTYSGPTGGGNMSFTAGFNFTIDAQGTFLINPPANLASYLTISGTTNQYTDDGTQLLRNGSPVGSGDVTNTYNTIISTNVTVVNSIKLQGKELGSTHVNGTNIYPVVNFTNTATVTWAVSGSNVTATAVSSGSGVTASVTPLAYSGTNITGFNCLTNNATYTLVLTNHCLFDASTFTGLPNTTTNMFFTLALQQNSTGTWVPKFTNTVVAWSEGIQPVITTNANSVSYLYFHSHLFTNGMLVGSANLNVK